MADKYLVEIEEIVNASGAEQAKDKIVAALRGIAAEAQQIASQAGGGAASDVAGQQSAEAELTRFRQGLEQAARGRQGGPGQLSQRELRGIFTQTLGTTSALPPDLQQYIRQAQYLSQQDIRKGKTDLIGGLGQTGKGPYRPLVPPGGGPPGNAERDKEIEAVQERSQRLQNLAIGGEWAKQKAQEVRDGYVLHAQTLEQLASNDTYARWRASATSSLSQVTAQQQRVLATDGDYARARAETARSLAVQSAAQQQLLAQDGTYARAQAVSARGKEIQAAAQQQLLAEDQTYLRAQAVVARAKSEQAAQVQAALAVDERYLEAQADIAASKSRQQASIQQQLADDGGYITSQAAVVRAKAEQAAGIQRELAADGGYITAQASTTRSKAVQAAAIQQALAEDSVYNSAQAVAARAKAQQAATVQQTLAMDGRYIQATAEAATARALTGAQVQEALARDQLYVDAQSRAAIAKAEQTARVQATLASDDRYAEATARAAAARDRVATRAAQAELQPQNIAANVDRRLAEENLRTNRGVAYNQAVINDPFLMAQQVALQETNEAVKRQRDIAMETARMDERVLAETAQLAELKEQRRTAEAGARLHVPMVAGESRDEYASRVNLAEQNRTIEQRTAQLRAIAADENGIRTQMVEQRVLERQNTQLIEQEVRQRRVQDAGGQILPGGSVFQRLQAMIRSRSTGDTVDPAALMGLGQFVGSRILTTAGFAFSGAAIYGVVRGIHSMVEEADQLNLAMSQVKAQMDSLGQGDQFSSFRAGILSISRDTGTAGKDVAQIGLLMRGAFGDNQTALENTRSTVEAMKVTGLEGADAINVFIALSKTFGVSVQDVSDKALGLQDRFGVMAKEIIQGAAGIAPIAQQVGLTFNQLSSLIASSAQVSGRNAGQIAEGFGRILPELQKNAGPILALYQQVPNLRPELPKIQEEFRSGNEGQVLVSLAENWNQLTKAQQNNFLALLGGPRNAQVLADAMQNQGKLVRELNGDYNDGGRTTKGYADFQATLAATLARLRVELAQIGDSLARMGALDSLKLLAGGLEGVLKVLGFLTRLMADFNDLMHGIPGRILGLVVAFKALEAAITAARAAQAAMNEVQAAGGVTGLARRVLQGEAAAEGGGELGAVEGPVYGPELPPRFPRIGGAGGFIGLGRGGFLSRLGGAQIGGASVTGLGGEGVFGGRLAAGSAGLGAATLGLGIADTYAVQLALHERGRLSQEEKDAAKTNEDQFRGMSLQQLLDVQQAGIYQQGTGRGEGYNLPQQVALGLVTGGLANIPGVKKILPSKESFGDFIGGRIGVGDFVRGRTQAENQQRDAIRQTTISEFDAAAAAGLLSGTGMTQKQIDDLKKKVDAGKDQGTAQRLLATAQQKNRVAYRDLVSSVSTKKRIQDQIAAGQTTDEVIAVADIQEALSGGLINYPDAIKRVNEQIANLTRAGGADPSNTELHKQWLQALKTGQQISAQYLSSQASLFQQIGQAIGQNPIAAAMPGLEASLGILGTSPNVDQTAIRRTLQRAGEQAPANTLLDKLRTNQIDPQDAAQQAQQALGIQNQALQDAMQHASSQAEALRIGEAGAKVDPQTEAVLVEAARQLYGQNAADELQKILDTGVHLTDQQRIQKQQDVLAEQISAIQAKTAGARDPGVQADTAKQIAQAQAAAAAALPDDDANKAKAITDAAVATANANNQAADVDTAARQAAHALTQAKANRDPVAIAADRLKEARENLQEAKDQQRGPAAISAAGKEVEDAQQASDDANAEIARARIALTKAQHPNDAIAQARAAQDEADLAAKTAHGQAAELAAQAQRVAADRQMQDAIQAVADSRVKLLQAQMQVAGDDIGAAEQGVKLAQSALDAARARGDGEEVTNQLQANLEQAKGQLRDTTISSREDVIQFNLDMKRITIGQAIEQLNALLSIANPKEQMDIMRRIKQLRDQATQDLQFNIPQDIKLPTLYEVNRTLQTPTGQGYNDNRQVSVTMHINNGMDQAAATRWLSSAVGQAPRVVTGSRRV